MIPIYYDSSWTAQVLQGIQITGTGTTNFIAPALGYYGISVSFGGTMSGDTSLSITQMQLVMATNQIAAVQRTSADFDTQMTSLTSYVPIGAGIKLSNTTNYLDLGGAMTQVQTPANTNWISYWNDPYAQITSTDGFKNDVARKGNYNYVKPTSSSSFNFSDYINYDANAKQVSDLAFVADQIEGFVATAYQAPAATQSLVLNHAMTGAYRTEVKTIPKSMASISDWDVESAMKIISMAPQFMFNEDHVTKIRNFLKSVFNGASRAVEFGSKVLPLVETIGSLF